MLTVLFIVRLPAVRKRSDSLSIGAIAGPELARVEYVDVTDIEGGDWSTFEVLR